MSNLSHNFFLDVKLVSFSVTTHLTIYSPNLSQLDLQLNKPYTTVIRVHVLAE